jgi:hypothetical protein
MQTEAVLTCAASSHAATTSLERLFGFKTLWSMAAAICATV